MADWSQIGGMMTAAGIVGGGLLRLWGAIKKRFESIDTSRAQQITELKGHLEGMMAEHEAKDSGRHDDNLQAFKEIRKEQVYVGKALVALGWRNGSGHFEKPRD